MDFRPTLGKLGSMFLISLVVSYFVTRFSYPPNIHGYNIQFFYRFGATFLMVFIVSYILVSFIIRKEDFLKTDITKKRKYWLWGGIAGASIPLIFLVFVLPFFLLQLGESSGDFSLILQWILIIVGFFLVGLIIGWVYGKFRNRKFNQI